MLADFGQRTFLICSDTLSIFLETTLSQQTFIVLCVILAQASVNLVIQRYANKDKRPDKSAISAIVWFTQLNLL